MDEPNANEGPTEATAPPEGTPLLRKVLFAILGVLIVAFAYDFLYARKAHKNAVGKIDELIAPPDGSEMIVSAEPFTQEQIRREIGREPADEIIKDSCLVETYRWRSGLPWRSHDLYVIYTNTDPPRFHDMSIGEPPEAGQFPILVSDFKLPKGAFENLTKPGESTAETGTDGNETDARGTDEESSQTGNRT